MNTAAEVIGDRRMGGIERLLQKAAEDPLVRKVVEEERSRKLKRRKRTAAMIGRYEPFKKYNKLMSSYSNYNK